MVVQGPIRTFANERLAAAVEGVGCPPHHDHPVELLDFIHSPLWLELTYVLNDVVGAAGLNDLLDCVTSARWGTAGTGRQNQPAHVMCDW